MRYLLFVLAALAGAPRAVAFAADQSVVSAPAPDPQQAAPAAPAAPAGQALTLPATVCDQTVPPPSKLPPAGSPPLFAGILLCFEKQGGTPTIEANTYLYYIEAKSKISRPSGDVWVPYTPAVEQTVLGDFKRLWATNFLDDLSIDVRDVRFANGVMGKLVIYDLEERQKIKIVDYVGSKKVEQSKIEEELKKKELLLRLDSFIDSGTVKKVAGVVRDMYAEKGYQYAEVKPEITPMEGAGSKLVHLTFNITEGPKVKIRDIDFVGNQAMSDGKLNKHLKENKTHGMFKFILGSGTFKEAKFDDDAERVVAFYHDNGYINARVGQPELKTLEDAKDGKTRYVELRIPVSEGRKYKIGDVSFEGNKV